MSEGEIPRAMRIQPCASCQAPVIFLKTAAGKNMPVNADTVQPGDELFDPKKHVSHFANCPNAAKHRRKR